MEMSSQQKHYWARSRQARHWDIGGNMCCECGGIGDEAHEVLQLFWGAACFLWQMDLDHV